MATSSYWAPGVKYWVAEKCPGQKLPDLALWAGLAVASWAAVIGAGYFVWSAI